MKTIFIASFTLLGLWQFSDLAKAENLNHLTQLLSSKNCVSCDLTGSGLVNANLSGANLKKANLSDANLSRANLAGADLSYANLTGASLNGANLTGANLTGTDLRDSYLQNANLKGTQLNTAYIQGATGIPSSAGTPDLFYSWGVMEMNKGNYKSSLEYYNKALELDPGFSRAYLGRAFSQFRLGYSQKAIDDAKIAARIFEEQKNTAGVESSENLIKSIEVASKPPEVKPSEPDFLEFVQGLLTFGLQFVRF